MKIRIPQSAISGEVAALSSSILASSANAGGQQPGIHLLAESPDRIVLSAYNSRDHAEFIIQGTVDEPGVILIAADKAFPALISSLAGQDLELSKSKGGTALSLKTKSAEYSVPTLVSGDWPEFPAVPEEGTVRGTVKTADLLKAIQRAGKASANNDAKRPILEGMLFEMKEGSLVLSATDSYRMSVRSVPATVEGDGGCVVHSRSLDMLNRMAKLIQTAPEVEVAIEGSRRVSFNVPGRLRLACAIMGDRSKFPNISRVLPPTVAVDVEVDRREFLAAYRRIALFVGDSNTNAVLLTVDDLGILTMVAESAASSLGTGRETIAAVQTHAFDQPEEDYRIGLNSKFLSDGLGLVEGDSLRLRFTPMGGTQMLLLTEADEEYPGTENFYLLIAFRLSK